MKRIILLVVAVVATVIPMATAQASVTATCTEHANQPYYDLDTSSVTGQGWVTCSANTGPIEVNTRLIKIINGNQTLMPVGKHTCTFNNYCEKTVYDNVQAACWKTRTWAYIGPNRNPTGASTSTAWCE